MEQNLAKEIIKHFNLNLLSIDERIALQNALDIIKKNEEDNKKQKEIALLKEKYEKKYFCINDSVLTYFDKIENSYSYKGWYISNIEGDFVQQKNQNKWTICQGQLSSHLLMPKLNMKGETIEEALIKNAKEITQAEAEEWLKKWFKQLKKELI